MPFYDYQCGDCDLTFEVEKPMSAPHPDMCPECGGENVVRYWFQAPSIGFPGRPIWTYNDCKKYKTATHEGVTVKVDPTKQGGLKSSPGEFVRKKK